MSRDKGPSLSVVIPVYNEASILAKSIREVHSYVSAEYDEFEIIIVQSGSTDESAKISDTLGQQLPGIKVIHQSNREGFGSAIRLGFSAARMETVSIYTVDMAFPLDALKKASALIGRHEAILSYRSEDFRRSIFRKLQSVVYNLLVRYILGIKAKHVNSACKMFKRKMLMQLPLESNGWFIDTEIVFWIQRKKISFATIPVPLLERQGSQSTVKLVTGIGVFKELWAFRKRNKGHSKPSSSLNYQK